MTLLLFLSLLGLVAVAAGALGVLAGWQAGQDAWDELDAENRRLREQLIDQWVEGREGLA